MVEILRPPETGERTEEREVFLEPFKMVITPLANGGMIPIPELGRRLWEKRDVGLPGFFRDAEGGENENWWVEHRLKTVIKGVRKHKLIIPVHGKTIDTAERQRQGNPLYPEEEIRRLGIAAYYWWEDERRVQANNPNDRLRRPGRWERITANCRRDYPKLFPQREPPPTEEPGLTLEELKTEQFEIIYQEVLKTNLPPLDVMSGQKLEQIRIKLQRRMDIIFDYQSAEQICRAYAFLKGRVLQGAVDFNNDYLLEALCRLTDYLGKNDCNFGELLKRGQDTSFTLPVIPERNVS